MQKYIDSSLNPKTGKPSSIMVWTKPETAEQKRYFSKFSGVLQNLTNTRRALQYWLWMPIAAYSMAWLLQDMLTRFISLPLWPLFLICLYVTYRLHLLLTSDYQMHFFDKWDENPDTNSNILFPVILGCFLAFLEFRATTEFLREQLNPPAEMATTGQDSLYSRQAALAMSEYQQTKEAIDLAYRQQAQLLAPTLLRQVDYWKNKKARTWKDRQYIRAKLRKAQKALDTQPGLMKLRLATATRLDSLLTLQQAELTRLKTERNNAIVSIRNKNVASVEEYETKRAGAAHIGGFISIISFAVFLYCARREVRIKTRSGIFPIRHFTDLKAHGSAWEKISLILGDVFTRGLHKLLYQYHKRNSRLIGPLMGFDGSLIMPDGNYQGNGAPQLNGNATHVVATTDINLKLYKILRRIGQYHAKWNNPIGGDTKTILSQLSTDWQNADEIVQLEGITLEMQGKYETLLRKHNKLMEKPRPRELAALKN